MHTDEFLYLCAFLTGLLMGALGGAIFGFLYLAMKSCAVA
jgi:hypothetical protein